MCHAGVREWKLSMCGLVLVIHTTLTSNADNVSLELALLPLLKKMEEVKKQKQYKHGEWMNAPPPPPPPPAQIHKKTHTQTETE